MIRCDRSNAVTKSADSIFILTVGILCQTQFPQIPPQRMRLQTQGFLDMLQGKGGPPPHDLKIGQRGPGIGMIGVKPTALAKCMSTSDHRHS